MFLFHFRDTFGEQFLLEKKIVGGFFFLAQLPFVITTKREGLMTITTSGELRIPIDRVQKFPIYKYRARPICNTGVFA